MMGEKKYIRKVETRRERKMSPTRETSASDRRRGALGPKGERREVEPMTADSEGG